MHVGFGLSSRIVHPVWDSTVAEISWARLGRTVLERRSVAVIGSCSHGYLVVARVCLKKQARGYRKGCRSSMNPCVWPRSGVAGERVELAEAHAMSRTSGASDDSRGRSRTTSLRFQGIDVVQSVRAVHAANARWQCTHSLTRSRPSDVTASAAMKRLRAEGRGTLAGAIMAFWVSELVVPTVGSRPLAGALVAALRDEDRGELADQVELLPSATR
ncbi:hypothetical protein WMF45_19720 [Sorangium sp. So ce448]|uniref:hypothetical protein n=1 Tax=Sorangium sp. So ce448 TaxID=3133314 RepID=UPI003F637E8E